MARPSPQQAMLPLDLPASHPPKRDAPIVETPVGAADWAMRLIEAFEDSAQNSGFIELAEAAVAAFPGDSRILMLGAMAALLDVQPERALAWLKRLSKRYHATPRMSTGGRAVRAGAAL